MLIRWSIRKTGKKAYRIPDIETTDYIRVNQFTKYVAVGEAIVDGKLLRFRGFLWWTLKLHQPID